MGGMRRNRAKTGLRGPAVGGTGGWEAVLGKSIGMGARAGANGSRGRSCSQNCVKPANSLDWRSAVALLR